MQIHYCPPMPAHQTLSPEPQFSKVSYAVKRATFGREGVRSMDGLAFEDYTRCHARVSKLNCGRGFPPAWVNSNRQCAEVIARQMLKRAGFREPPAGKSPTEQLQLAQSVLMKERKPRLEQLLKSLACEYTNLKRENPHAEKLKMLRREIQIVDSQLLILSRAPAVYAMLIYYYWRLAWNGLQTARVLHIQYEHCRILIMRVKRTAKELGFD